MQRPPIFTLFPYTTLFRSDELLDALGRPAVDRRRPERVDRDRRLALHHSEPGTIVVTVRSEEHTSELQSPCNLVCRLLLEKKNRDTRLHRQYPPRRPELTS